MDTSEGVTENGIRDQDGPTDVLSPNDAAIVAAATEQACPTCGTANPGAPPNRGPISPTWVYAIGKIEPQFPSLSVEKEFKQVVALAGSTTADLSDRAATLRVLSDPENAYLVRQLCWVFSVQGIETYILAPRYQPDYEALLNAYRAAPEPGDMDVVVGARGGIANPAACNGLSLPVVIFDKIYSFTRKALLAKLPVPKDADPERFTAAAGEVFDRIVAQSDNAGALPADRALNYLAVRYDQIYTAIAQAFATNSSFTSVQVRPSALSGARQIVEVIFAVTDRATDVVAKHFVRVDVTEEFPFLVSKLAPYYDISGR